jgi:Lrp/AsnC family transcriptional regulator, leucine-responsive regulatory protein
MPTDKNFDLDKTDAKILETLAQDGRITWSELGQQIGLSLTPTLRRVQALQERGCITGYQATIDETRVGYTLSVMVSVTLSAQTDEALAKFEKQVSEITDVMSCFMMTGDVDYHLRVAVPDLEGYQRFISKLTKIQGVARVTSSFALKRVLERHCPALRTSARPRKRPGKAS